MGNTDGFESMQDAATPKNLKRGTRSGILFLAFAALAGVALAGSATALSLWWPGQPGDYRALVMQKLAPFAGSAPDEPALRDAADRHIFRGNKLLAQRQLTEAAGEFERAVAEQPASALGWVNLGVAYYHLGRTNETREVWLRAHSMDKYNFLVAYNLGLMLELQGELSKAREFYRRASILDPHNEDIARRLARLKLIER